LKNTGLQVDQLAINDDNDDDDVDDEGFV